jgi:hypothetical protein
MNQQSVFPSFLLWLVSFWLFLTNSDFMLFGLLPISIQVG